MSAAVDSFSADFHAAERKRKEKEAADFSAAFHAAERARRAPLASPSGGGGASEASFRVILSERSEPKDLLTSRSAAPSRKDNHDVYHGVKADAAAGVSSRNVIPSVSSRNVIPSERQRAEGSSKDFSTPHGTRAHRFAAGPLARSCSAQNDSAGALRPVSAGFTHASGKLPGQTPRDAQRAETDRAFRTADAFLPLDPAVYLRSTEAYDAYAARYDAAAGEEAKLHTLGGRSARELPQTLMENLGAGALGAVRGIVNEAG